MAPKPIIFAFNYLLLLYLCHFFTFLLICFLVQLIRGVSPSRKYGSDKKKKGVTSVLQDSTGSVTITSDTNDDIPMQQLGS